MSSLVEVVQTRIIEVGKDDKKSLRPEIRVREIFTRPGCSVSPASTPEDVIAIALAKAKYFDSDRGVTFIQGFGYDPYQANGPWNFSAAAHERHGLTKRD